MKGSIRVLDYYTIFCIIYFRNSPLILYLIFNFVVRYYQSQHLKKKKCFQMIKHKITVLN